MTNGRFKTPKWNETLRDLLPEPEGLSGEFDAPIKKPTAEQLAFRTSPKTDTLPHIIHAQDHTHHAIQSVVNRPPFPAHKDTEPYTLAYTPPSRNNPTVHPYTQRHKEDLEAFKKTINQNSGTLEASGIPPNGMTLLGNKPYQFFIETPDPLQSTSLLTLECRSQLDLPGANSVKSHVIRVTPLVDGAVISYEDLAFNDIKEPFILRPHDVLNPANHIAWDEGIILKVSTVSGGKNHLVIPIITIISNPHRSIPPIRLWKSEDYNQRLKQASDNSASTEEIK